MRWWSVRESKPPPCICSPPLSRSQDGRVNLWWTENGQRAGSFNGHNGVVWTVDIDSASERLLTGAGDSTVRLWNFQTGEEAHRFRFHEPCRAVRFNLAENMAALSTDPFMSSASSIRLVRVAPLGEEQSDEVVQTLTGPRGRIARLEWVDGDRTLISASDDGVVRRWDVETGKILVENTIHERNIQDLQMSTDGTHFVTASADRSAKLVDAETLEVMKTYQSTVPVNSAAISPLYDHVLIGGGQEASQVTTTAGRAGKFESRIFHKVFAEEFANIRGHFGPINAVAFMPDGSGFVSGGEEGYIRLHHFDADYFTTKFF
ncbi:hypothetical protein H632_c812p0 [Helicosporidium sp. ATCC 50920]|nr:hypothetical protein H632_c812p0 [Helicosporidium sp. ATCC 50920]|eukprot:KDD75202.1 hypothetical protein H632_c812p0 [Helicosporidium sp. ATCC 50920]